MRNIGNVNITGKYDMIDGRYDNDIYSDKFK